MNSQEFREFGKAAVDFIADYWENIRERDVLPSVEPGYLAKLLPQNAPEQPENWKDVMGDVEKVIMPGMTHWTSPNFHAYYPSGTSPASVVGEIISSGFGIIGINWLASPASAELEVLMMDWMAKLLRLPEHFLNSHEGKGGGAIQSSASESVLVALVTGRELAVQRYLGQGTGLTESEIRGKLVAYSSDQSNSCIEKAGILAGVPIRLLETDEKCSLRGETVLKAVEEDLAAGLIPCVVLATLGTTQTCAFDNLQEIAPICNQHKIWLHVDAAYAGAVFCCEEYNHLMAGLESVDSLNVNMHKWMMVNFDCCAMWLRDSSLILKAMRVERIYLSHQYNINMSMEHRHWNISLGRRMRSLKLWFHLRIMGAEQIRNKFRQQIGHAKLFEELVRDDPRFEVVGEAVLGLVVFRLKAGCGQTKELLERLTAKKKIYMIAGTIFGKYAIRYVVGGMDPTEEDTRFAWGEIQGVMREMENGDEYQVTKKVELERERVENEKEDQLMEAMAKHLEGVVVNEEYDR